VLVSVGVGVLVGVDVAVLVGVGVAVGFGVSVGAGVSVGLGVGVAVGNVACVAAMAAWTVASRSGVGVLLHAVSRMLDKTRRAESSFISLLLVCHSRLRRKV
jgi:hypothetical protein